MGAKEVGRLVGAEDVGANVGLADTVGLAVGTIHKEISEKVGEIVFT